MRRLFRPSREGWKVKGCGNQQSDPPHSGTKDHAIELELLLS